VAAREAASTSGTGAVEVVGLLRAAGLSPTAQRRTVFEVLAGYERPVSAAEVHDVLRGRGLRIGLTTVYRTLHALAEVGLVHVFAGEERRYRLCLPAPHVHLVCEACGLVIEGSVDAARRWWEPARKEADFVVNVEHSDVYGTCGRCLAGLRAG
jgi:Fur family ferric uptake transcriptional regulator